jgi:hypothetical protein
MFIDGNSSKQRQNSASLHPTDTTKPKLNSLNDTNSNKTTSRKKSRKSIKTLQQSILSTNNNENGTSDYLTSIEQNAQSNNFINEDNQTIHSIVDITNQSTGHRNISTDNNDDFHLNTIDAEPTKTTVCTQYTFFRTINLFEESNFYLFIGHAMLYLLIF